MNLFRASLFSLAAFAASFSTQVTAETTVAGVTIPTELEQLMAVRPDAPNLGQLQVFPSLDSDENPSALQVGGDGPVLVNFWATWCAPCKAEMPHLNAAAAELGDEGLTVLAVSLDRSEAVAREYIAQEGFDSLNLMFDRRMKTFRALGGRGVPYTALLDRQGRVIADLSGILDWSSPEVLSLLRLFTATES